MSSKRKTGFVAFKKLSAAVMSAAILCTGFVGFRNSFSLSVTTKAATTDYGLAQTSQEGVILHCWNWSYNNIKKYMKDIAAAGYTSVQTSPVQQPKDYYWEGVAHGNVGIPNGTGGEDGNWWKAYQPVTFNICDNGHTWYGTKAEFKAMCAEAEKYGIKVIVDIVANHMGNIQGYKIASKSDPIEKQQKAVMDDITPQVGEFWEPEMLTDPSYWHISTSWTHSSDGRFDVTQGNMGMPDLNTGDSKVQNMVLGLLKECIDCGADGFRFDAAKHIETPKDNAAFASNFWDVVLDGARDYYKKVNGNDGVYFYGEVLNRLDDTNAENYYLSKMSLTDNSTSDNLRNSVVHGSVNALATSNYCGYIHGKGNRAVLWAESHDTYMGGGSSYDANDADIKKTWVILASRKDSTALFFARPYYSKDILAGDVSKARQSSTVILENLGGDQTQLGDVGSLTWADPEVVAANRFRNFFIGQSEKLGATGNTAYNVRGTTGIVIVRGEGPGAVSISGTGMKDGTYTDQVSGEKFTVSGGKITGTIKNANGIAVVYNPSVDYGKVNPVKPTVLKINASTADGKNVFYTNDIDVKITTEGASVAKYTTSEGASGTLTGTSATVNIGKYTATGEDVTLTVTATSSDGNKKERSYTYSKKTESAEYPTLSKGGVVFDNSGYNWAKVYCYAYTGDGAVKNAAWPGVEMNAENGDYYSYEFPSTLTGTVSVIFSNGSGVQYPGSGQAGLTMSNTAKKLFKSGALEDLPESTPTLKVTLKATYDSLAVGQPITLKATASNASGTVKYTFLANDGTTIRAAGTSNTCTWTPEKAGSYIIAVQATDSSRTITSVTTLDIESSAKLTASLKYSTENGKIILNGSASGGTPPYQYQFYYKKSSDTSWVTLKTYSTVSSASFTPTSSTSYDVCLKVKDAAGTVAKSTKTISYIIPPAQSKLTLSTTYITLGQTVKATATASGASQPYKYAFYYKNTDQTSWTTAQDYSTNNSVVIKPRHTGTYSVTVKIKDSTGAIQKITKSVKVAPAKLANKLTLSSENISLGSKVKATASASGGKSPYQYAFYYKNENQSSWTKAQDYDTNSIVYIKPRHTGKYTICVRTKDSAGTVVKSYADVNVAAEFSLSATVSKTSVTLGNSFTLKGTCSGGISPYKYAFYYKKSSASSWTTAKALSTTSSATIKPTAKGEYTLSVKAVDSAGNVKKQHFTVTVK